MSKLFRFELSKICSFRKLLAGCVIIALVIISFLTSFLSSAFSYDEQGNEISGLKAIKREIEVFHPMAGEISEDKLSQLITYHKELMADPENISDYGTLTDAAYIKYWYPYRIFDTLLSNAFALDGKYDHKLIETLTAEDAYQFYEARLEKVNSYLNDDYKEGNFTEQEKEYFNGLAASVSTPFRYDYHGGWRNLFLNWQSFIIMITVLMCVYIAPVFSNEAHTHVDMILFASYYGRSKVFYSKVKAALLYSTLLFVIAVFLFTGSTFFLYGTYGWNSSLQSLSYMAPYNLNILQVYLMIVANSYLAYISIMAMVLLISSLAKSNFQSVIISLSLYFVPIIIPSESSRTLTKIIDLFPIKMMDGFQSFRNYKIYCFGKIVIPQHIFVPIIAMLFIILFLTFAYFVNKNHHIEETN